MTVQYNVLDTVTIEFCHDNLKTDLFFINPQRACARGLQ